MIAEEDISTRPPDLTGIETSHSKVIPPTETTRKPPEERRDFKGPSIYEAASADPMLINDFIPEETSDLQDRIGQLNKKGFRNSRIIPFELQQKQNGQDLSLTFATDESGRIVTPDNAQGEGVKDVWVIQRGQDGSLVVTRDGQEVGRYSQNDFSRFRAVAIRTGDNLIGLAGFNPDTNIVNVYRPYELASKTWPADPKEQERLYQEQTEKGRRYLEELKAKTAAQSTPASAELSITTSETIPTSTAESITDPALTSQAPESVPNTETSSISTSAPVAEAATTSETANPQPEDPNKYKGTAYEVVKSGRPVLIYSADMRPSSQNVRKADQLRNQISEDFYDGKPVSFHLRHGKEASSIGFAVDASGKKLIIPESIHSEQAKNAWIFQKGPDNMLVINKGDKEVGRFSPEDLKNFKTLAFKVSDEITLALNNFDPETNTFEVYKIPDELLMAQEPLPQKEIKKPEETSNEKAVEIGNNVKRSNIKGILARLPGFPQMGTVRINISGKEIKIDPRHLVGAAGAIITALLINGERNPMANLPDPTLMSSRQPTAFFQTGELPPPPANITANPPEGVLKAPFVPPGREISQAIPQNPAENNPLTPAEINLLTYEKGDMLNQLTMDHLNASFASREKENQPIDIDPDKLDKLREVYMYAMSKLNGYSRPRTPDEIKEGEEYKDFPQEIADMLVQYYFDHPEHLYFTTKSDTEKNPTLKNHYRKFKTQEEIDYGLEDYFHFLQEIAKEKGIQI